MTSVSMVEVHSPTGNPIDLVEEIVVANEWAHDRASEEEMIVEISGRWCDYRLFFVWQEEISAMHFSCAFDMKVPKNRRAAVYELLALINEKLWLGHFDMWEEDGLIVYRHTLLLPDGPPPMRLLEQVVENALSECERFYPAFQFAIWGGKGPKEAIAAAMIETAGEA